MRWEEEESQGGVGVGEIQGRGDTLYKGVCGEEWWNGRAWRGVRVRVVEVRRCVCEACRAAGVVAGVVRRWAFKRRSAIAACVAVQSRLT